MALRFRRDAVVVVAELVEQDVQQLVGAGRALGPPAQDLPLPSLAGKVKAVKDVLVLLACLGRPRSRRC
jgi:hypothetical protein